MLKQFLLGVVAMACATAGLFFFRFWQASRDTLFLAFGAYFTLEAACRTILAFSANPSEGSPWIYVVRLVALVLVLAAIVKKNYGKNG
jgi:uncharacterized membrane protein HdeD (DUF308 family)